MSRHGVWDRDDVHPAWMINELLRAESVECTFQFPGYGRCGAAVGQRCRIIPGTYIAPNGKEIRFAPAHFTRYAAADAALGRRRPRPHRHVEAS
jgi:hypothetical protein